VGHVREWLFTPRAKFETFDDLNRWLEKRCDELASRKHPTSPSRAIAEYFQQEQPFLRQIETPFAGYIEHLLKVTSTCLVRVDRNQYSVPAQWAGQVVSVRVTAYNLSIVAAGKTIASHQRSFLRDRLIRNPWHYLTVLEKKPGALRHGAPFQNWDLPNQFRESGQNYWNKTWVTEPLLICCYLLETPDWMRLKLPVSWRWNQEL
jgi:hypothetical protein